MALNLRTPGVYVVEESKFPPSVVPVETAIPAFVGYTSATQYRGESLLNRPVAVNDLLEFQAIFGGPPSIGNFAVTLDETGNVVGAVADPNTGTNARFRLAYALRHFYDNGGGRCYIVSIGDYADSAVTADIVDAHLAGLNALAREDEPTLLVLPDLSGMTPATPVTAATAGRGAGVVPLGARPGAQPVRDAGRPFSDLRPVGRRRGRERRNHRVPQWHRHPKSEIRRGVSPVHPDHHAVELERRDDHRHAARSSQRRRDPDTTESSQRHESDGSQDARDQCESSDLRQCACELGRFSVDSAASGSRRRRLCHRRQNARRLEVSGEREPGVCASL